MKALECDLVLYWWFTDHHGFEGCMAFRESLESLQNAYDKGTKEYCAIKTCRDLAFHKGQLYRMQDNQRQFVEGS